MKEKFLPLTAILSLLLLTGCQDNNLTAENKALKQEITELQHQIAELEESNEDKDTSTEDNPAVETTTQNIENSTNNTGSSPSDNAVSSQNPQDIDNTSSANTATTHTLEDLTAMVDEFVTSVGSTSPNPNNSENLDQFFTLKKEANVIDHALENYENQLENQYRAGTLSREKFRKLDREIEQLEDTLDSAEDRLEITFGIDD